MLQRCFSFNLAWTSALIRCAARFSCVWKVGRHLSKPLQQCWWRDLLSFHPRQYFLYSVLSLNSPEASPSPHFASSKVSKVMITATANC
uniref:Secreted protein n=1 Tax=Physcomitrium patens TaxID=3218 RepID=A0A7I3ZH34_PHYPA